MSSSELHNKHLMVIRQTDEDILLEDVTHGYPGVGFYLIRHDGFEHGKLIVSKLTEKEIKP